MTPERSRGSTATGTVLISTATRWIRGRPAGAVQFSRNPCGGQIHLFDHVVSACAGDDGFDLDGNGVCEVEGKHGSVLTPWRFDLPTAESVDSHLDEVDRAPLNADGKAGTRGGAGAPDDPAREALNERRRGRGFAAGRERVPHAEALRAPPLAPAWPALKRGCGGRAADPRRACRRRRGGWSRTVPRVPRDRGTETLRPRRPRVRS